MAIFADKRGFVRYIEESDTGAVLLRRSLIVNKLPFVMDEDVIHELRWAVRKCENELALRGIVFPKPGKRKAKK